MTEVAYWYGSEAPRMGGGMKGSKSDELVLGPLELGGPPPLDPSSPVHYFSDSESSPASPLGRLPRCLYDRVDPQDSIKDIISENDFYRFVLFKKHYDKYLNISKRYEEARSIAYYLEEKYHEIKAERDSLVATRIELERRLEKKEAEMHEKEDELFLQLEKAIRLEEDCEKLRAEKEKILEWKNRLEKEKNQAYRQLKLEAQESEATRRRLERARHDVVRQVTAIVAEKDDLEKENTRLKEALKDIERKSRGRNRSGRSLVSLEKELCELKVAAKQSASLNSQLKKAMRHLATCRRAKCSVCAYTRATFSDYPQSALQLPNTSLKNSGRSGSSGKVGCCTAGDSGGLSYIDEGSSSSGEEGGGEEEEEEEEEEDDEAAYYAASTASTSSTAPPHAFSSDSGFSSDLTPSKSLRRGGKWTSSFRKLIRRVSKRQPPPT